MGRFQARGGAWRSVCGRPTSGRCRIIAATQTPNRSLSSRTATQAANSGKMAVKDAQSLPRALSGVHTSRVSLTGFICSCGREKMASFSMTTRIVGKLACQLFNKETWHISPSTRAIRTCQGENMLAWTTLYKKPTDYPPICLDSQPI